MAGLSDYSQKTNLYDSSEFTVANATTDYDVKVNESDSFISVPTAGIVSFTTDQTVSIKFNKTTDSAITVTSSESPKLVTWLQVSNIFITNNSGSIANIKLQLYKF